MPTIMAVHAHPDDECTSTGGILAKYAAEGCTTIVVTCTNGELGDLPGGIKPGQDGHDHNEVVRIRRAELERSCEILNITHVEMLGYRDSGMSDWDYKDHPDAFAVVAPDIAAARLAQLFERYRPDVVISYEDDGLYDHPDHVQASRVTMAAVHSTKIPKKAYFSTIRGSRFARMREVMIEHGVEMPDFPEPDEEFFKRSEALEARVTTNVDVSAFMDQKREALRQHSSQVDEGWFGTMPEKAFEVVFSEESFVRVYDTTGAPLPENDLLAGLR